MRSRPAWALAFWLAALAASFCSSATAQVDLRQLEGIRGSQLDPSAAPADLLKVSASFTPPQAGRTTLHVTADLAPGWHTYSITQQPGGPIRSKIKLTPSPDYKLVGEFRALTPPETHEYTEIWPGLKVEEHHGRISWSATLELAPGIDPATLEIPGALYAQICAKECLAPQDYKFVARLSKPARTASTPSVRSALKVAGPADAATAPRGNEFRAPQAYVGFGGQLSASAVRPGGAARLSITAQLDPDWHIYPLADKDPKQVAKPTLIVFDPTAPLNFGAPSASKEPLVKPSIVTPGAVERFHDGSVTWEIPVNIPVGTPPGDYPIRGMIGYQTCRDDVCDLPRAASFETTLTVGQPTSAKAEPLHFAEAKYSEVAATAERRNPAGHPADSTAVASSATAAPATPAAAAGAAAISTEFDESALAENVQTNYPWTVLLLSAFFGGMILNLMPCVFPVIGLKVLSFVEQSHHDRARLLTLNLWYSLGVVAVFLALALIAVVLRNFVGVDFKYGNQNAIQGYAIGMAAVMFVMGLSLLGVWEIPIPGFLGAGKAGHVVQQEGPVGAVAKGALTTLLGASCSGPLVAVAFGFALDRSTPAWATLGTFAVIGLGMASPYLLLGANPRLLRFLPKPGPWMDTFKHLCGFILLATTVWVLSFLKFTYVTPTVAFLIGLWAACWWVGRVPLTEPPVTRLRAWALGGLFAVLVGLFAFNWLASAMAEKFEAQISREIADRIQQGSQIGPVAGPSSGSTEGDSRLRWQPFSKNLLKQLARDHKTVMVDFTADWCLNCKALEKAVLNTAEIKSVVEQNGVVPLIADYTDAPAELTEMMNLLKAGAVPVLAIFPAGDPNKPIVFRGGYTKRTLIDALREAGPSKSVASRSGFSLTRPE